MRYTDARINVRAEEIQLRCYITEALYAIAHNTGSPGAGGQVMQSHFSDRYKREDTRTAEEIIDRIKSKLKG